MLHLLVTAAAAFSQQPLGYPIFVSNTDGKCEFQIEDMIMVRGKDLREWMEEMPEKKMQVDLVWSEAGDRSCLRKARTLVIKSGFSKIVVRRRGDAQYPSGLPPVR